MSYFHDYDTANFCDQLLNRNCYFNIINSIFKGARGMVKMLQNAGILKNLSNLSMWNF